MKNAEPAEPSTLPCCDLASPWHPAHFRIDELHDGKIVAYSDTYACAACLGSLIGSGAGRVTTSWLVTLVEVG